jgi:hypothetical protein
MTIDVDSTIYEVHGHHKGGAAYGYTRQLDLEYRLGEYLGMANQQA